MALRTKSIQRKVSKSDGLRICIMRRPGEYQDWDMWWPVLAPSHELLNQRKHGDMSWSSFETEYTNTVLKKQLALIHLLVQLAQSETVTLLCFEETADQCHRRLLVEACQKIDPNLKVTLK